MVVISSSHNYKKTNLYTFVTSLNQSGFLGEKVMIVYECNSSTIKFLKENGWKLYQKKLNGIQNITKRFEDISDILQNYGDSEQILFTDSRDVYFHKNPELLSPHDLFIGIDGDCSLEKNEWATKEMIKMYPSKYNELKNKYHLCCGVVFGKNKIVRNLLKDTFDFTFKSTLANSSIFDGNTVDQMALNVIAYNKYNYKVEEKDIVINLGSTYWNTKKEYFIYHQYDRISNFWSKIKTNVKKTAL